MRLVASHQQSHEVSKRSSRSHSPVYLLPPHQLPQVLEDIVLHKRVARRNLIGKHRAIDRWCHHCPYEGILVEASEKLIMKVRVVRLDLVIQHGLTGPQQLLLRTWLV